MKKQWRSFEMKTKRMVINVVALVFIAATAFAGAQKEGQADDYPSKPIRLVIGNAPGGSNETAARMWQPFFEKEIGTTLVIESLPGADGIIGGRALVSAEPDGYTFSSSAATAPVAQTLILNAPYKFEDFEIVCNYINDPLAILVHKDSQWKTMKDLIQYAKSQPPESISFGLTNLTTADNIILHMIEQNEGIKFNFVPFQGGNAARMALAGQHVDAMMASFFGSQSIWEYTRVLAVVQEKNLWADLTDNAPTLNEALGYQLPPVADTISLFAPAGFSTKYPERYKKFLDALFKAFNNPEYLASLEKTGQKGRFRPLNAEDSRKVLDGVYTMYKENLRFVSQK
jgi:tripartite-type tricarboxylate transporter receptor subunit TctC